MSRKDKKDSKHGFYTTDHSSAGKGCCEKYWWMSERQKRRAIAREGKPQ